MADSAVTADAVTVDELTSGIVAVTLNRPPVNALATAAYREIRGTFTALANRKGLSFAFTINSSRYTRAVILQHQDILCWLF